MLTVALTWALVWFAQIPAQGGGSANACAVLTTDEIKGALGRKDVGAAKAGRPPGGYSECTFPGVGYGDVRVLLSPSSKTAIADFDSKAQILREEGKTFEKLAAVGDRAYYYDDRVEFLVGDRAAAVWINRTPRTESPSSVKAALTTLGSRIAARLRER